MAIQGVQTAIPLPMEGIRALCRQYGVKELAVFGSVLRDDFREDSDLDFMVAFDAEDCGPWLEKLSRMESDLARLLGKKVDLVARSAVEQSDNYIRRHYILSGAQTIYAA